MKKYRFFLCLIISLSNSAALFADRGTALVGGTLINGLGSTPIQNSVILVKDGQVEQVGTVDTLAVPHT